MESLSKKEAYLAMFAFLEERYEMTQSDDLGVLLGSMMLLDDGETADPAVWHEWCDAIEKSLSGATNENFDLK